MPLARRRHWGLAVLGILAGILAPACLRAAGLEQDAAPAFACPIAGTSDGVLRGVNRTNLAWEENWQAILDRIVAGKVTSVRLTLTQPIKRTADIVAHANRSGLQVLLNVPLSLADYYAPSVKARPGNDKIRAIRRLSDIDVGRYRETLRQFLAELDQRQARLMGLEVGNEINWADFNGDFPVDTEGRILERLSPSQSPADAAILAGFRKYRQALDATRDVARAGAAGKAALLVSAGLYAPSAWVRQSGGYALSLAATKAAFDDLGISTAVDALAVHVYPPTGAAGEVTSAKAYEALRSATEICGPRGDGKPCLITEWGYPNASATACQDDRDRLVLFRSFEQAVSCLDRARDLRATYLFSWDENPRYSVWRCNRALDGSKVFGDPSID